MPRNQVAKVFFWHSLFAQFVSMKNHLCWPLVCIFCRTLRTIRMTTVSYTLRLYCDSNLVPRRATVLLESREERPIRKIGYSFSLYAKKTNWIAVLRKNGLRYLKYFLCLLCLFSQKWKVICQGQEMRTVENKVSADRSIIGFLTFFGALLVHEKTFISTSHKTQRKTAFFYSS